MKQLSYEEFMYIIPDETALVIVTAIELYKANKYRMFLGYDFSSQKRQKISKRNKILLCLFLAIFYNENEVGKVLRKAKITEKIVYNYLKNSIATELKVVFGSYGIVFNREFRDVLYKIMKQTKGIKDESYLSLEALVYALYEGIYDEPSILTTMCLYNEIDIDRWNTVFDNIRELRNKKIKEKNNDTDKSVSSDLGVLTVTKNGRKTKKNNGEKYLKEMGEVLNNRDFSSNPAVGREKELEDLEIALLTPETSAILVGEAGVGKTAIVEGLAYKIQKNQVPEALKSKEIVKVDVTSLVAGTAYRGQFEEKVQKVLKEAAKNPNIILFLDEIHTAMKMGCCDDSDLSLANILKPYLDRGNVKIIGATTEREYDEFVMADEAFKRRFERVSIKEPKEEIIVEILRNLVPKLEKLTKVKFPYSESETIKLTTFIAKATAKINRNYADKINNPDLAIKIFSKAFVLASFRNAPVLEPIYLAESMRRCERLSAATRERLANLFLTNFKDFSGKNEETSKIIPLERVRRLK